MPTTTSTSNLDQGEPQFATRDVARAEPVLEAISLSSKPTQSISVPGAVTESAQKDSSSSRSSQPPSLNTTGNKRAPTEPPFIRRRSLDPTKNAPVRWSRSSDSTTLRNTLRDFDRFLSGLPVSLHPIVPRLVARAICRVLAKNKIMATNLAFDIALLFWRIIINVFFRSIQPRGAWRIPREDEGPVIFVAAPHHNQFLDPLLLASEVRRGSGRRVAFLIAEKSIKRRFIGAAARLMQSIPVARAADSAKHGEGSIELDVSDPLVLKGIGTKFTKQLVVKGQVCLPKVLGYATAEVVEIVSDTEVRIKKEFKDAKVVKALKEGLPSGHFDKDDGGGGKNGTGVAYKCLPFVDQTQMYSAVYERLADGGCLGIFPEGGSHDRTDLLPLKAGVVIMALGAMAANPGLRVRIVPVGMSYFHPHKFRSRAVVEFGSPIDVPRELVSAFKKGGDGKRTAVGEMMDIVFDGLKSVTVRAPDWETLMFIQAGRRLYTPPGQHTSLSQVVELNRRFIIGYHRFKDEKRIVKLKEDVLKYNKMLAYAGLKDHQVERATRAGWRSLGLLFYRSGLLAMWGGLALPGVILNAPVFILAKVISHRKAKEALAASQVKLEGRDVLATWKVLVSLGVAPVLYTFYAGVATYLARRRGLDFGAQLRTTIYTFILLPLMSYSALKFGEVGADIYKSLPPLVVSLMPGNQKVIHNLQSTRSRLAKDLHALIEELAPQVWDDFDTRRMLAPAESRAPPKRNEREALIWKEKSGANTDGSSLLSHPFKAVDEWVFGWGGRETRKRRSTTESGRRRDNQSQEIKDDAVNSALKADGEEADASRQQAANDTQHADGEEEEEENSAEYDSPEDDEHDEGDYETVFRMLGPLNPFRSDADPDSVPNTPRTPGTAGGGRRSRTHSRSRSGSNAGGETFAEKRTRSSTDLKALAPGPMSPAEFKNATALSPGGGGGGGGGASSSAIAWGPGGNLEDVTRRRTTAAADNGEKRPSSAGRRDRTHSLSEAISARDLRDASRSPSEANQPLEELSARLEAQAQSTAGKRRAVVQSAEETPVGTPTGAK